LIILPDPVGKKNKTKQIFFFFATQHFLDADVSIQGARATGVGAELGLGVSDVKSTK
jgi:hypothetical protein